MDWYYRDGENQVGPVTDETMNSLIQSGDIVKPTPVWREGMPDWAEAGQTELATIFETFATTSQPPPLSKRTIFQRVADSFRAGARRVALANELRRIKASRLARQQERDCIWIAIGTRAQTASPASHGADGTATFPNSVGEARSAVDDAQNALDTAQRELVRQNAELTRRQQHLTSIEAANAERLASLDADFATATAEAKRLETAAKLVASSITEVDGQIKVVQRDMANTAAGQPDAKPANVLLGEKSKLDQQRAVLSESLAKATAEARTAKAQSDQKKTILATAKSEASSQESQAQKAIKEATALSEEGAKQVRLADNALQMSRKSLGKAMYESGTLPTDYADFLAQGTSVDRSLSDLDARAADVQAQIAALAPAVRRLVAASLFLVVAAIAMATCFRVLSRDEDSRGRYVEQNPHADNATDVAAMQALLRAAAQQAAQPQPQQEGPSPYVPNPSYEQEQYNALSMAIRHPNRPAPSRPVTQKCYQCQGLGNLPCDMCGGSGRDMMYASPHVTTPLCDKCKGTGRVSCPSCRGRQ